ncbi:MAG: bifunctional tetrahydrofolate synthase/dihydrofolate synthase [Pseudomonadota bacterium]|nr:bifunctional tetrahydrofolate synthase/dihydrofolate synthase [Pseudomonadota bacterium]
MNLSNTDAPVASGSRPGPGATVGDWLAWLEAIHPTEIDLGLDRVLIVLRRLFPTKPKARIITVAGTNGKGSTVATIEGLLRANGRSTGAYTSPHLQVYNERVRINGADIDDACLVAAFEQVEAARRGVSLTYFEFGTLAAFVAFQQAGVEDWVLEVGLGGRLDAVNVLDADFAVITSIDIDHIGFLGDNRESIGFEKAGILRPGIVAVCADPEPPSSVLQQATAQKVSLQRVGEGYQLLPGEEASQPVMLRFEGESVALPAGPLPVESVAAGVVLMRFLEPSVPLASFAGQAKAIRVAGRFEQLSQQPAVYVDVGHNPHAARWLARRLDPMALSGHRIRAVFSALADKDVEGVMAAMASVVDEWHLAPLAVPRGLSADQLATRAAAVSADQVAVHGSVDKALSEVWRSAEPENVIIVFGSFFTVAAARAWWFARTDHSAS